MGQSWLTLSAFLKNAWRIVDAPRYAVPAAMVETSKALRRWLPPSRSGRSGAIRQCSIRITDRCNLRCPTCGQWGESGYLVDAPAAELRARELPPSRYLELLRDLAHHRHSPSVYVWGGEPMLYRGTPQVLEEAARLGMAPSLATNGVGVPPLASGFVTAPLFLLQVSVDGPDAETHDACRPAAGNEPGSFAVACAAIEAVRTRRGEASRALPIIASLTTINHTNAGRLVDLHDAFCDRLDVMVFYLGWWIDSDTAARHEADFEARFGERPSSHRGWIGSWRPSDFSGLSRQLRELRRRGRRPSGPGVIVLPDLWREEDLRRYYTEHGARFGFERCVAIHGAIELNANGDVSPCRDYNDFVVGNVKQHTLTELWNSERFIAFRRSLARGLMPVCSRCCGLMGN